MHLTNKTDPSTWARYWRKHSEFGHDPYNSLHCRDMWWNVAVYVCPQSKP